MIFSRDVAATLLFEYANGTQFERMETVRVDEKRYQSVKFWNLVSITSTFFPLFNKTTVENISQQLDN